MSSYDDVVESIEPDNRASSTFDIDEETYSVNSSITAYRIENGRQYHAYKEGTYWAPNDDTQNEVLDIGHHKFLKLLDGKLFLAPLETNIKKVLDVGTGTGIWAIDFADEFPNTSVLGIDLSPTQPQMVPPNCRFEVDDASDPWTYRLNYFDFIYMRSLFGSITDWPELYKKAFNHLKPGQWIEHLEPSILIKSDDNTLPPNSALSKMSDFFVEAGKITGKRFDIAESMKDKIEAAGFVNVTETIFKMPMSPWPSDTKLKELGRWTLLGFDMGLEGYLMAVYTRTLGWSRTEVQVFAAQVRAAIKDQAIHSYIDIRVVYAQKPT